MLLDSARGLIMNVQNSEGNGMDFLQLAKERHSVRKYATAAVEADKLENILEAGRVAPTAANRQPQRFLVVSTSEGLSRLGKAARLHGAPLAIVVCATMRLSRSNISSEI